MAFADEVVKDGRGVVYRLDVSLDQWSSIAHRWATRAGVDASNDYDPRIVGLGNIARALGTGHLLQVGSVELTLRNEDAGVDWLVNQSSLAQVLRARARLYIGLYAVDAPTSIEWKQLGEYMFGESPRATVDQVRAVLMDASAAGFLDAPVVTPTLQDWYDDDASASTNPLRALQPHHAFSEATWFHGIRDVQLPIAFGDGPVKGLRIAETRILWDTGSGVRYAIPFLVCMTTDTAVATAHEVTEVWIGSLTQERQNRHDTGALLKPRPLPASITENVNGTLVTRPMFAAFKSSTITVDGRNWKAVWCAIDALGFTLWAADVMGLPQGASLTQSIDFAEKVLVDAWFYGYPLSARTWQGSKEQTPSDVITDLVTYYSKAGASYLDTASLQRVKDNHPYECFGVVNELGADARSLGEHLSDIGASFDVDPYITWEGKVGLSARNRDFNAITETRTFIGETRFADGSVEHWLPPREARGAPYNRVVLSGGRFDPTANREPPTGPFDDPGNSQSDSASGRILTKHLSLAWVPPKNYGRSPWFMRTLDATLRPRIRFTTDLEGLLLELGQYLELTWTRGLGGPYASATVFQVEALTVHCEQNQVTVEAMWAGDLVTDRSYILDDETLLLRVASSGGRTATVTDASDEVVFSSGDLLGDEVEVGDHLVLLDSTEALDSFRRYKACPIVEVVDATTLRISDPHDALDFDAPTGTAVASWEIRRSHVTYPTPDSDVANYPTQEAANAYGRVAGVANVYSAEGTGGFTDPHKLLDG